MEGPIIGNLIPIPEVWKRLERVEQRLYEATEAEDEFLTKIARHLLTAGGKRLRPLLAQITAELGPGGDDRPVEAGVAVELIHLGSLYHDDVIDEGAIRRGTASVNANWGNTLAILAGDFLMARASEVAAASLGQESVRLLARTYAELCEGQVLELQLVGSLNQDPADYFRVIGQKTASLIRTSARLGAMAADGQDRVVEGVSEWAWEVGVAFQMIDDLLDLTATEEFLGKPVGSDVAEGKLTLPVLYALDGRDGDLLGRLLDGPPPYDTETVSEVLDLVRESGAIERVTDETVARMDGASRIAGELPEGPAREVLLGLSRYLLLRLEAGGIPVS